MAQEVSLEAKTLFNIANDLHEMEVHGKLDEADIGQIVGLAFGAYPASRAARLDPMVALRFE